MSGSAPDPDALLCALVLVPGSFSRNRFFALYQHADLRRVRQRAARVRSIVRQLACDGRERGEIVGEQILEDGRVLLRFHVARLAFSRTTALSRLEAAVLRYALHRAGAGPLDAEDKALVEAALGRLGRDLPDGLG